MTVTAQTMIQRAMRLLGATDPEETPTTQELTDGLYALNSMLDSWAIEDLMIYALTDTKVDLVAGQSVYTVGSGGDIDIARPDEIVSAYIQQNNIRYYIDIIDEIRAKSVVTTDQQSNLPTLLWYSPSYPLGSVNLYYIPSDATVDLHILTETVLQSFASLSTEVALPRGYQAAIEANLAIEYGPEFSIQAPQDVRNRARTAKAAIKLQNKKRTIPTVRSELAEMAGSAIFNWYAGE